MAIAFPNLSDAIRRTTNIVQPNTAYTCMFWFRYTGAVGPVLMYQGNDPVTLYTKYVLIWIANSGGAKLFADVNNGGLPINLTAGTIPIVLNQWYHVVYTRTGTSHELYLNGDSVGTGTMAVAGDVYDNLWLGDDSGGFVADSEFAEFREWQVVLTADEISSEARATAAVKTASLFTDTPLLSDLLDDSGNAHNWTAIGSNSFGSSSFPRNISAELAEPITTLTFTDTLTVDFNGITYDVWYKYTAVSGDKLIGSFGFGDLVTYKPRARVYSDAGITQIVDSGTSFQNRPVQFFVTVSNTYWLRFTPNAGNPTPAVLTLDVRKLTLQAIPTGSIAVNDDTDGFPLILLSGINGEDYNVLNAINSGFPNGEAGDVLETGQSLWADATASNLKLYDKDFVLLATVALNVGFEIPIRTNNGNNLFYVGIPGSPVTVRTVNSVGAIGGTTYTLTGSTSIAGLASNLAGTILYYARKEATAPVRRWDLSSDTALSDLVGATGAYRISDILVLDDDTIVVLHYNSVFGDFIIKRYSSAGATLNTYATTSTRFPSGTFPRLAYAIDNPNSFWVMFHPSPIGIARFENWKASDGSVLASIDHIEYETGAYNAAETATPLSRFGVSFSCPFIITRANAGVETGTIIVGKVTDPFDGTQVFSFTAGGGLSPTSFNLLSEASQEFLNVPAGNGYSIVETQLADWFITYLVSNGSPNTNITVGVDENVTVMVLNQLRATRTGLYQLVPGKTNDTYVEQDGDEIDMAIPNPFAITGFLVDK